MVLNDIHDIFFFCFRCRRFSSFDQIILRNTSIKYLFKIVQILVEGAFQIIHFFCCHLFDILIIINIFSDE